MFNLNQFDYNEQNLPRLLNRYLKAFSLQPFEMLVREFDFILTIMIRSQPEANVLYRKSIAYLEDDEIEYFLNSLSLDMLCILNKITRSYDVEYGD